MRTLALPVAVLLGLAGCAGAPQGSPNADPDDPGLVLPPEESATILGSVVDESFLPVEGATAELGDRKASSDSQGRFTFRGVPQGEAELRVAKDGYQAATKKLTLVAGQEIRLTIELSIIPTDVPHVSTVIVEGFLACSLPGTIYYNLTNPCPEALKQNQKDRFKIPFELAGLENILWELVWESNWPGPRPDLVGYLELDLTTAGPRIHTLIGARGFEHVKILQTPEFILPQTRPVEDPVSWVNVTGAPTDTQDIQDPMDPENFTHALGGGAYQQPITLYVSFGYFQKLSATDSFAPTKDS